jgi:hypothetical protein
MYSYGERGALSDAMKTLEEYKRYYETNILPNLVPLEEKRKITSRKIKRFEGFYCFLAGVIIIVVLKEQLAK